MSTNTNSGLSQYQSVESSESTTFVKVANLTTNHMLVMADGYLWNIESIKDLGNSLELTLRNDFSMMRNKPVLTLKKSQDVLCMVEEESFLTYDPSLVY